VFTGIVRGLLRPFVLSLFLFAPLFACKPLQKPPTRETLELHGKPYDRGFQYGQQYKSKIHSFYATLLTNSLFPYLSREQPDIATLIPKYGGEEYAGGKFAYQLLLDSALSIEKSLPLTMRDEMHGVADGSGMTYEQILILNTFVDTTLAVRGIALAIRLARAPLLKSVTSPARRTTAPTTTATAPSTKWARARSTRTFPNCSRTRSSCR